ncbi:MAG: FecR domain-containing protein [Magnetospirillum sp.]|nr:FecR domain-containing protein [Magnetospirillum sp.]
MFAARLVVLATLLALPAAAADGDIGQIKSATGAVSIERAGQRLVATPGERVRQTDVVSTGPDGAAGITFADNSTMALGPDTTLALERFRFDSTTNEGAFATRLSHGTLAVKSGKIVQQTPEAMTVQTPTAILGVRGTEFLVRAGKE